MSVDYYDSNETLEAKLKASGGKGYDLVVPSDYMVQILAAGNLLQEIGTSSLPNGKNVNPAFLDVYFDKGRKYSVPYLYGTTGYAYDPTVVTTPMTSWKDYFAAPAAAKGKIGIFNDQVDGIHAALRAVGGEPCTSDPAKLQAAQDLLLKFKASVATISSDGIIDRMQAGESPLSMIWNGAAHRVKEKKPKVVYVYPTEGATLWQDNFAIPSGAENVEQAKTFLNWFLDPKNAAEAANRPGLQQRHRGRRRVAHREDASGPGSRPAGGSGSPGEAGPAVHGCRAEELLEDLGAVQGVTADLVLVGRVWTGAGVEQGLAVRDGRVVAVGADALALRADAAEVVELGAGLALPAFGDGHAHPVFGGLEEAGPAVRDAVSVEAVAAAVQLWAEQHPEAEWVVGGSYDPALAPGGRFDARWLDAVVPDRPVVLRAADYHTVWCNSEALSRAGVDASTPDPALGLIERRPDGSPLGTLREWQACDLVLDAAPSPSPTDLEAALRWAADRLAAAGISWVQDAWVDLETGALDAYLALAGRGELSVRAGLALRADPLRWRDQLEEFTAARARVEAEGAGLVRIGTVKFFADGVVEGGTAAMLEPYDDDPHSHGMPVWDWDELKSAAAAVDALGFQLHIHAIGDAGDQGGARHRRTRDRRQRTAGSPTRRRAPRRSCTRRMCRASWRSASSRTSNRCGLSATLSWTSSPRRARRRAGRVAVPDGDAAELGRAAVVRQRLARVVARSA
jgi:ABC-type Fe3+ transport system substrate-binding protein